MNLAVQFLMGVAASVLATLLIYGGSLIVRNVRGSQPAGRRTRKDHRRFIGADLSPFGLSVSTAIGIALLVTVSAWIALRNRISINWVAMGTLGLLTMLLILDRVRELRTSNWLHDDSISEITLEMTSVATQVVVAKLAELQFHPIGGVCTSVLIYNKGQNDFDIRSSHSSNGQDTSESFVRMLKGLAAQVYEKNEHRNIRFSPANQRHSWEVWSARLPAGETDVDWNSICCIPLLPTSEIRLGVLTIAIERELTESQMDEVLEIGLNYSHNVGIVLMQSPRVNG